MLKLLNQQKQRLNPYSTGSNSNKNVENIRLNDGKSLNPYSTGSNSNNLDDEANYNISIVS